MRPCAEDRKLHGREWVRSQIPKVEQRYMVGLCDGCPVRRECYQMALDDGHADGVWGGLMWRDGFSSNPRADAPVKKSSVRGVHWQEDRQRWKAYGHTPRGEDGKRRFVHLGDFVTEDEAIKVVTKWREENGQPVR